MRQVLRLTLMRVAEGVTGSLDATKTLGCNRSGGYDIFRPFLSRYLFRVIQESNHEEQKIRYLGATADDYREYVKAMSSALL